MTAIDLRVLLGFAIAALLAIFIESVVFANLIMISRGSW